MPMRVWWCLGSTGRSIWIDHTDAITTYSFSTHRDIENIVNEYVWRVILCFLCPYVSIC